MTKNGNHEPVAELTRLDGDHPAAVVTKLPAKRKSLPAVASPGPTTLAAIPSMSDWQPPTTPSPDTKAAKAWALLLVEAGSDPGIAEKVRAMIGEHVTLERA